MSSHNFDVSGTPEQIESQLEELRSDLTKTVDQLADRVKPANLIADLKRTLIEGAEDAKAKALKLVEDAKSGDGEAIKTLAIAGGATAAVIGLVAWRGLR